ncbi:transmembrane protein 230 isoform X1 [Cryptosporidium felis]|nr:transmembrane protein 230 isoform X1 [Cryptosporidium felis]
MDVYQRRCAPEKEGDTAQVNTQERHKGQEQHKTSSTSKLIGLLGKSLKPRIDFPLRPVFLSFFLLVVGTCFLYLGVFLVLSGTYYDSVPSLLLGALCIIPGSYYSFSILQIFRGVPNYSFDELGIS